MLLPRDLNNSTGQFVSIIATDMNELLLLVAVAIVVSVIVIAVVVGLMLWWRLSNGSVFIRRYAKNARIQILI